MIVFALWLVTSSYATEIARYPSPMACSSVAVSMDVALAKPPRSVLATTMCVPTLIILPARPQEKPEHPSAES